MHRMPGVIIPLFGFIRPPGQRGTGVFPQSVRSAGAIAGIAGSKLLPAAKHAFMTFWYSHARLLNSLFPSVTLQGKRLVIFPEVYKPLENEQACSEYCREGDRVLDLGCGSGVGSVFCAPKAREVITVDISLPAVRNTEENCRFTG